MLVPVASNWARYTTLACVQQHLVVLLVGCLQLQN
jgi:hypothetical protein